MGYHIFAIVIALIACVLCTSEALLEWSEGHDMNWLLLFLGILNGILCLLDTCFLARDFLMK